jgi:arylsulfatase A-like enzyme
LWGRSCEKSSVTEWHKQFKWSSNVKIFFNIQGIVHFEFIPHDQTVNQAYYIEILKWLRENVRSKRPELWCNDWILHRDNAPAHWVLPVKQFPAEKSITEAEHPPCSPYLVPNDCQLFPKIKSALRGRRFQDIEDIQKNVTTTLKVVPQQELQKCFQ